MLSTPPVWKSISGPRYFAAIAEHSMCQPGKPSPQGLSHLSVPPGLGGLPEREVPLVALQRVGVDRARLLPGLRPRCRESLPYSPNFDDLEVDIAVDLIREPPGH